MITNTRPRKVRGSTVIKKMLELHKKASDPRAADMVFANLYRENGAQIPVHERPPKSMWKSGQASTKKEGPK